MQKTKYITFISNRKKVMVDSNTVLYVMKTGKCMEVHVADGTVYETRMQLNLLEE